MNEENDLPYAGTAGYVSGSDTSRERAQREAASGVATHRQKLVLAWLDERPEGMTWKELSTFMGLHHGQISGTLSVLHKVGKVAQLQTKRENCHPYISMRFINEYPLTDLILVPSQTKAGWRRQALEKVVAAARLVDRDYNLESSALLREALTQLDAISDT